MDVARLSIPSYFLKAYLTRPVAVDVPSTAVTFPHAALVQAVPVTPLTAAGVHLPTASFKAVLAITSFAAGVVVAVAIAARIYASVLPASSPVTASFKPVSFQVTMAAFIVASVVVTIASSSVTCAIASALALVAPSKITFASS